MNIPTTGSAYGSGFDWSRIHIATILSHFPMMAGGNVDVNSTNIAECLACISTASFNLRRKRGPEHANVSFILLCRIAKERTKRDKLAVIPPVPMIIQYFFSPSGRHFSSARRDGVDVRPLLLHAFAIRSPNTRLRI